MAHSTRVCRLCEEQPAFQLCSHATVAALTRSPAWGFAPYLSAGNGKEQQRYRTETFDEHEELGMACDLALDEADTHCSPKHAGCSSRLAFPPGAQGKTCFRTSSSSSRQHLSVKYSTRSLMALPPTLSSLGEQLHTFSPATSKLTPLPRRIYRTDRSLFSKVASQSAASSLSPARLYAPAPSATEGGTAGEGAIHFEKLDDAKYEEMRRLIFADE